jgi:hypothetical protein
MAYDKTEIRDQALAAIEENELTTIAEVVTFLPCDMATLYCSEEWQLEVLEPIKSKLEDKKTSLKAKMKRDWRKEGASPVLQIAAFKLIADQEELDVLNTSKVQQEHSGKVKTESEVAITDLPDELIQAVIDAKKGQYQTKG